MTRALPFAFDAAERAGHLAPAVELQWSDRYLGRAIFRASGSADDGLPAERVALVYRTQSSELVQLKSSGTSISVQRRNGATLAVTSAWALLATAGASGADVAITRAGTGLVDLWAIWVDSSTAVKAMRSTDGGATWAAAVTVYRAGAGNTIGTLLHGGDALIGIEERRSGLTSLLQFYMAGSTGTWGVYEPNVDSGGSQVWGGGITTEAGTLAIFAVDIAETTSAGTVSVRTARVYDLDALAFRGRLHVGASGACAGGNLGRSLPPMAGCSWWSRCKSHAARATQATGSACTPGAPRRSRHFTR